MSISSGSSLTLPKGTITYLSLTGTTTFTHTSTITPIPQPPIFDFSPTNARCQNQELSIQSTITQLNLSNGKSTIVNQGALGCINDGSLNEACCPQSFGGAVYYIADGCPSGYTGRAPGTMQDDYFQTMGVGEVLQEGNEGWFVVEGWAGTACCPTGPSPLTAAGLSLEYRGPLFCMYTATADTRTTTSIEASASPILIYASTNLILLNSASTRTGLTTPPTNSAAATDRNSNPHHDPERGTAGLSKGALVGIVVGLILAVVLIFGFLILWKINEKKKRRALMGRFRPTGPASGSGREKLPVETAYETDSGGTQAGGGRDDRDENGWRAA